MKNLFNICLIAAIVVFAFSCGKYELPEANSKADVTPPTAGFTYTIDPDDYTRVSFTNTSLSATDYNWNFGNGTTSSEKSPTINYEAIDKLYTVTLVSTDKHNVSDSKSDDIVIMEPTEVPLPSISESSFEDDDYNECLSGNEGGNTEPALDGRDCWRNDVGGVIQITESPVLSGTQAGKLPSAGDRVGMQQVEVLPDTDYNLSFWYTMKSDPGTLTVAVLNDFVTDFSQVEDATIASLELTDNSDPNTYVREILSFNSGGYSQISIYFHNEGSECRVDDFEFVE